MSVESIAAVLHHSHASGTPKLVLVGIANHDGDGGAWPSIATLAKYAGCSERTVQRAIEFLVEHEELQVHVQGGGTSETPLYLRPNRYEILVRCPLDCDGSTQHRTPPGDAAVTPPGDKGVADPVTHTSPKPSLEPSLEPPNDRRPAPSGQRLPEPPPDPEAVQAALADARNRIHPDPDHQVDPSVMVPGDPALVPPAERERKDLE